MVSDPLEQRISNLEQQILTLTNRLDSLTGRLDQARSPAAHRVPVKKNSDTDSSEEQYSTIPDIDSDLVWSWVGKSALLPRIAAICFILVFALILRTLTDNTIIHVQLGSYLGMGYAALLIGWGARLLAKQSRLATVFPVCGVLLMYSIVLETYIRFGTVTSLTAYSLLFTLLVVTSLVSIRYRHVSLGMLSIFGTCLVSSFIDFPRPYFTPLAYLIITGNILAFLSAKKLDKGEWNRFLVFLLTVSVWLLWTFRLRVPLTKGMISDFYLSQGWFYPTTVLLATFYMLMSAWVALRKKATFFDLSLPTLNVLWSFPMALVVVKAGGDSQFMQGVIGMLFALAHFGFAAYLFKRQSDAIKAVISFSIAGLFLFILATPLTFGTILPALLGCSIIGFVLAKLSQKIAVGGFRLISYLLQGSASFLGFTSGAFLTGSTQPFPALITAGLIAGLSGSQFLWCRNEPPAAGNGFFAFDTSDRSAIILLLTCLTSGFAMLHLGSFLAISSFSTDPMNTLKGVQSILINIGSIGLLFLAMPKRNKEVLTTAVIVIVIGAFKVFTYDLLKTSGIPLVLSVLSFGAVAAVGSVLLSRWSRNE